MNKNLLTRLFSIFLCIVFSVSVTVFLWVTKNGIGIGYDSFSYISTAERLLRGSSTFVNMTPHFPPMYTFMLALTGSFTGDVIASARWLHAFLYGANAVLIGVIIYYSTRKNLLASALGILVFLTSRSVISMQVYALSESLFFFFSLLTCLFFSVYIQLSKTRFLVLAALFAGMAVLTRYVGAALIPPLAIGILCLTRQTIRQKIKALITLAVFSVTPVAFWILRNILFFDSAANRMLVYHARSVRRIASQVIELFFPYIFGDMSASKYVQRSAIALLALVVVLIIVFLLRKQIFSSQPDQSGMAVFSMWLLFSVTYLLMLVLSMNFFDAATQMNDRILLPVYILFIPSMISLLFIFSSHVSKIPVWPLITVAILLSVWAGFPSWMKEIQTLHTDGIGFNSVLWNESPTLKRLKELPADTLVYSNGNSLITLKTGLSTETLPKIYQSTTGIQNPRFEIQLDAICEEVRLGQAVMVYLDQIGREYLPKEFEIQNQCHLPVLLDTKDGIIWGLPQ